MRVLDVAHVRPATAAADKIADVKLAAATARCQIFMLCTAQHPQGLLPLEAMRIVADGESVRTAACWGRWLAAARHKASPQQPKFLQGCGLISSRSSLQLCKRHPAADRLCQSGKNFSEDAVAQLQPVTAYLQNQPAHAELAAAAGSAAGAPSAVGGEQLASSSTV